MPGDNPALGDNYWQVGVLQDKLRSLGFDPGDTNNDFGAATQAALHAFQQSRGIPVSDMLSDQAWAMMVSGAAPNPGNLTIAQQAQATYGALGALFNIPELTPILTQAVQNGWSANLIQTKLMQTTWWKTTTASQRQWDQLVAEDPASTKSQVDSLVGNISTMLTKEGASMPAGTLQTLATTMLRNGITDQTTIQRMALAQAQANPNGGGLLGVDAGQIKATAAQYGLPMTDQVAAQYAQQIEAGTADHNTVGDVLKNQAKAAYAHFAPQIDAGYTVRQILDPQIQAVAQNLEVSPNDINLLDPKWSNLASVSDNGTTRSMTLSEATQFARQQPEYRKTASAMSQAAALGQQLLTTFGKVAG